MVLLVALLAAQAKIYLRPASGFEIVKRKAHMKGVLLGIVLTLAVLYPAVTKEIFGRGVDTMNSVATGALKEAGK